MKTQMKYTPVKTGEARLTGGFWNSRVTDYKDIIASMESALMNEGNAARMLNFGIAAGEIEGEFYMNEWSDGDCYKFLEGCANQYAVTEDTRILAIMDRYIPWIEKAQEADGYIGTQTTLTDRVRWADVEYHELYNMGHLFTAGVVVKEAVGDDRLLKVACRAADYLCTVFIPLNKDLGNMGFNPSQIMGLVDLYQDTGEKRYLELADTFVTMRGTKFGTGDQNQNRTALREETQPVGHVVTAAYLYAGAADVFALTGDDSLMDALKRIWDDLISSKIYITGGASPFYCGISERGDRVWEAFGDEYDLPHRVSYNETCANIGLAMWARRMLALSGEAQYGDWMETILFNAGISGASLDMKRYFYANPLSHRINEKIKPDFGMYSHVPNERFHTFDCWCCPPQLWRTFTGMPKWIYSTGRDGVLINLFADSTLDSHLPGGAPVRVSIKTDYPWDEKVVISVDEAPDEGMVLTFRIPSWCRSPELNGESVTSGMKTVEVKRGEVLTIVLPMNVTLYRANPMVEQANGMLAVRRGPVFYCLEGHDIADGISIDELALPVEAEFTEEVIRDLPYGMTGLRTRFIHRPKGAALYDPVEKDSGRMVEVRLIPYFAWANRSESDMSVWFPRA